MDEVWIASWGVGLIAFVRLIRVPWKVRERQLRRQLGRNSYSRQDKSHRTR